MHPELARGLTHRRALHVPYLFLPQCSMKLWTTTAQSGWRLLQYRIGSQDGRINNCEVPGTRVGRREALCTCMLLGTPSVRDQNNPKPRSTSKCVPRSRRRRPTVAGCFWGIGLGRSPPAMPVSGCWRTGSRGGPRPRQNSYTGPHASSPLARRSSNT